MNKQSNWLLLSPAAVLDDLVSARILLVIKPPGRDLDLNHRNHKLRRDYNHFADWSSRMW